MGGRGLRKLFVVSLLVGFTTWAGAQSFRVQCPASTITHPNSAANNSEPAYTGPTVFGTVPVSGTSGGYVTPTANVNGAIKCQQISGGDGYATMGDGTQTYLFAFGPLSGLADIAAGRAGTEYPAVFNTVYSGTFEVGDPAVTDGATSGASPGIAVGGGTAFNYNGAVGLAPEVVNTVSISDVTEGPLTAPAANPSCPAPGPNTVTAFTFEPLGVSVGASILISNLSTPGYNGTFVVTCVGTNTNVISPGGFSEYTITYQDPNPGLAALTLLTVGTASTFPAN